MVIHPRVRCRGRSGVTKVITPALSLLRCQRQIRTRPPYRFPNGVFSLSGTSCGPSARAPWDRWSAKLIPTSGKTQGGRSQMIATNARMPDNRGRSLVNTRTVKDLGGGQGAIAGWLANGNPALNPRLSQADVSAERRSSLSERAPLL